MDKKFIRELIDILECREWMTIHAAENRYCPDCVSANDDWRDQRDHYEGCEFVAAITKLRKLLNENENTGTVS